MRTPLTTKTTGVFRLNRWFCAPRHNAKDCVAAHQFALIPPDAISIQLDSGRLIFSFANVKKNKGVVVAVGPICNMIVDEKSALNFDRNGETYYFCSEHCRAKFAEQSVTFEDRFVETANTRCNHDERRAEPAHYTFAPTERMVTRFTFAHVPWRRK